MSIVHSRSVTLDDLTEHPGDGPEVPWLDRADCDDDLTASQRFWRENGYLILPGFLPEALMRAYEDLWRDEGNETTGKVPWKETPYTTRPVIRDLCLYPPLMAALGDLIGEPMALHLNLANWRSTRRDWHQDDYLNPPHVNSWYVAVWMAFDDIHPDAGPFEVVPGSNHWPLLRRDKVLRALGEDGSDPMWPTHSERLLSPLYDAEIERRGVDTFRFLGRRGDVLVWHARAVHRGTVPNDPDRERRALISHYSGVKHRGDMPVVRQHGGDTLSLWFDL